ncbi:MAG: DUF4396 domain-containing protein [Gemmatimonadota bacterium]
MRVIDIALVSWFALTGVSTAYVAWDAFTRNPEMRVMKWGWVLVTLYTGVIGAAIYVLSCKEPAAGTHEEFVKPLWKQALGSTIHCLAGDATGIIAAAAVTMALGLPMGLDVAAEYIFGFAFGLLIFQALFMREMFGGSYITALRRSFIPEWLSMNAVMAGMIPVMVVLMTRHMSAMEPGSLHFWGVMSLATLVGAAAAYPVNVWLVAVGLKHGMGTERALGRGGSPVLHAPGLPSTASSAHASHATSTHNGSPAGSPAASPPTRTQVAAVSVLSVVALAAGVLLAALFGDLTMRGRMPAHTPGVPMAPGMPHG